MFTFRGAHRRTHRGGLTRPLVRSLPGAPPLLDSRIFPPKECAGVRLSPPRPSPAAGSLRPLSAAAVIEGDRSARTPPRSPSTRSGRRSPSPGPAGQASPPRITSSNRSALAAPWRRIAPAAFGSRFVAGTALVRIIRSCGRTRGGGIFSQNLFPSPSLLKQQ